MCCDCKYHSVVCFTRDVKLMQPLCTGTKMAFSKYNAMLMTIDPVFLMTLYCVNERQSLNYVTLQWCHNGCDSVSNHQPHNCLLNRLFRRRSKKTSKLRVTGLCAGNSPVTGEFPAQMTSNAENVSIWWRHHECFLPVRCHYMTQSRLSDYRTLISPLQWSMSSNTKISWKWIWKCRLQNVHNFGLVLTP